MFFIDYNMFGTLAKRLRVSAGDVTHKDVGKSSGSKTQQKHNFYISGLPLWQYRLTGEPVSNVHVYVCVAVNKVTIES